MDHKHRYPVRGGISCTLFFLAATSAAQSQPPASPEPPAPPDAPPGLTEVTQEARRLLREQARRDGMRTMREDGIRKVLAGLTTIEEVVSATVGDHV